MAYVEIAEGHIPRLVRLSGEYDIELDKLINLIIAIGIETLENPEEMPDEPIDYELVGEEEP
jgi:hypothetical protein